MRTMNFGRRGAIAMLNNDEEPKPADTEAVGDNANSLETDLTEVESSAGEGEAEQATIDEAVDTKEALEGYKAALEEYMTDGGMDAKGARILAIGLEHFNKRMGVRPEDKIQIAIESFGGASTKLRSNQAALENIKEELGKVWKSIVAAIKRAIEWLKDHFNKIFGAAEKLEKRAKSIVDKAKAVTGSAKESKFENERLVKSLNINGAVPSSLSASLASVKDIAETVFGNIADFGTKTGENVLNILNNPNGTVADIKAMPYPGGKVKEMSAQEAQAGGFEAAPENMGLFRSPELPGGKAILARYCTKEVQGDAAVKVFTATTATLTAFSNKAAEVSKTELATLAVAEVQKTAEVVQEFARELIAYRAKADKAAEMKKKILAACDKLEKAAPKEEDKDKAALMGALQKVASASPNAIDKPAPQLAQYLLVTGKAALDYCEESLKQYK